MSGNLPALREQQNSLAIPDDELQHMLALATSFVKSGVLPTAIDTPQKALMVIMTGRELGIPAQVAVQNIYPMPKGGHMFSAKLTIAMIRRGGGDVVPVKTTPNEAIVRFTRPNGTTYEYGTTWEEAQESGWCYFGGDKIKPAWKGAGGRKIMLYNRAVTQGANMGMTDLLYNMFANPNDESLMVWDAEDEGFVTPETAERREVSRARDRAPLSHNSNSRRLFKDEAPRNGNGNGNGHHAEPEPEPEEHPIQDGDYREEEQDTQQPTAATEWTDKDVSDFRETLPGMEEPATQEAML